MFLPKVLALLALFEAGRAATCDSSASLGCITNDGALARTEDMWTARQNYCGSNLWKTNSCYTYRHGNLKVTLQITNPGANSQQTCWDAFENIINRTSSLGVSPLLTHI